MFKGTTSSTGDIWSKTSVLWSHVQWRTFSRDLLCTCSVYESLQRVIIVPLVHLHYGWIFSLWFYNCCLVVSCSPFFLLPFSSSSFLFMILFVYFCLFSCSLYPFTRDLWWCRSRSRSVNRDRRRQYSQSPTQRRSRSPAHYRSRRSSRDRYWFNKKKSLNQKENQHGTFLKIWKFTF